MKTGKNFIYPISLIAVGVLIGFFIGKRAQRQPAGYSDLQAPILTARQARLLMDGESIFCLRAVTQSLKLLHTADYDTLDSNLNRIAEISIETISARLDAENNGILGEVLNYSAAIWEAYDAAATQKIADKVIADFREVQTENFDQSIESDSSP